MRDGRLSKLPLALYPFLAFVGFFLLYPTGVVLYRSVSPGGSPGATALSRALEGSYRTAFITSIEISAASAVLGAVLGVTLALVISGLERPRWLRPTLESWSAVASQLGGVPLAFAFIAALGTQGVVTRLFKEVGIDITETGLDLSGFWGIVVVYLYFQLPLMFLVILPSVGGLRRTWREAAAIMGASPLRYWRSVALPILFPSVLGGTLLLFVNAFSAYATAYVLDSSRAIVPLQIRFLLQGNVITGEQDLAYAIVAWTVLLLLVAVLGMSLLNRKAALWTRG